MRFFITVSVLIAALFGIIAPSPSSANPVNTLSTPNTVGALIVRPVGQDSMGMTVALDGGAPGSAQDPNRFFNTTLAQSASANDTSIKVTSQSAFLPGDTIYVGSPYCDFASNAACVADAERNYVASVSASTIELGTPLIDAHANGTLVIKYPTTYTGEQYRLDIPNSALGMYPVKVTASLTVPGTPSPIALAEGISAPFNSIFTQLVVSAQGTTSFAIPNTLSERLAAGARFVPGSNTWYQAEVSAINSGGVVVAHGFARFKPNDVSFSSLKITPSQIQSGDLVTDTVSVLDAQNPLATARRVGGVQVTFVLNDPGGTENEKVSPSCYSDCGSSSYGSARVTFGGLVPPTAFQETFNTGTYSVLAFLTFHHPRIQSMAMFDVHPLCAPGSILTSCL